MKQWFKKTVAWMLAVIMLTSTMTMGTMAAQITTGTADHTIYLSLEYLSVGDVTAPAATVKAGDLFGLAINFSNNPTVKAQSIQGFSICMEYDTTKVAPYEFAGDYIQTYNTAFNSNTVFFNGTNTKGYTSGMKIAEKGQLTWIAFEAKKDLTAEDLASFQIVATATSSVGRDAETKVVDGTIGGAKTFTIIQVPGISASVKTGAEFFNSDSAEDVKADIKVEYVDAAGVASDVTADAAVTLPSGGLKVGANTVTVSYNGYTTEVEITAGEDAITGLSVSGGKLSYAAGEKLDMSGLKVSATYASGKSGEVADYSFEIDGAAVASDVVLTKGAHNGKVLTVVSGELEAEVGTLDVSAGKVGNYAVVGAGEIAVPAEGSSANTLTLSIGNVVDAYDDATEAENVSYSIGEYKGVSISNGKITVSTAAIENTFAENKLPITVTVNADGVEKTVVVTITREDSAAADVVIESEGTAVADSITVGIPTAGKAFTAPVVDQYGKEMAEADLSLTGDAGISLKDGVLTVDKDTVDGAKATLTATYDGKTDSVAITAKKVSVNWTEVSAKTEITYGAANASAITLPAESKGTAKAYISTGETTLTGVYTIVNGDVVSAVKDSPVSVKVVFTVDAGQEYAGSTFEKTYPVTVNPATLTVTGAVVTKEYDGSATSAQDNLKSVTLDGIVVDGDEVAVDLTNVNLSDYSGTDFGNEWTVTLSNITLTGAAADNYTVAPDYTCTNASITKTQLEASDFTVDASTTVTYDGAAKTVTVTSDVTDGAITVLYNGETSAVNAGEYAITINVTEGTNYAATSLPLDLSAKLIIDKADIALKDIPAIVLVGDETAVIAPKATLANANDTAAFTYTSADAAVVVAEDGTVSATGNAKTTITVAADAGNNYNSASKTVTVTAVAQPIESITVANAFNVTYTIEDGAIKISGQSVNPANVAVSAVTSATVTGVTIDTAISGSTVTVTIDGKPYTYNAEFAIEKVDAIIHAADAADTEVPGIAANLTSETMKAISDAAVAANVEEVNVTVTAEVVVDSEGNATVNATYTIEDMAGNPVPVADNAITATKNPVSVSIPTDKAENTKLMVKNAADEYETVVVTDGKITFETADFTNAFEIVEPVTITINYTYNKAKEDGSTTESIEYTIENLDTKLPEDSKAGYTFKGWQIGEKVYTTLTADLLDPANDSDGVYDAIASFKLKSSGSGSIGYVITVKDADNGTVKASDKTAGKGDTVTITVKPDKGYELDELTVTDKDGNELKLKSKGDGKYTFTMPKSKVTVEAAFVATEVEVETSFSDVAESAYYFDAVEWAVAEGITTGYANGTFLPNATCTRAQTVTFLWRAMGEPEPETTEMPFTDVAVGSYYYDAVLWAVENGITSGMTATTFAPNKTVTRAQTVTFLWRTAKMEGYDVSVGAETNILSYADASSIGEYAIPAMQWACGEEIMGGYADGTLRPNAGCTRAQIVTFLYRFLG